MVCPVLVSKPMDLKPILDLDYRLSKGMGVAEKPGVLRAIAVFFAHSGDSWFWSVALLIVWLLADPFWKRWAIALVACIVTLALLVFPLKQMIRRRRPEGMWGNIYRKTDPHSFPSGHAARAFMIAVLATGLGPAWLAIVLWIWAPFVSVARVAMGVHYLSDVLGGLALGLVAGLVFLQLLPPLMTFVIGLLPWLW
jgi:membrane-associated phospholipid phosphatase